MSWVQLKTCLDPTVQDVVAQKTPDACNAGQTCTTEKLLQMANAKLSVEQCATIKQICHAYDPQSYSTTGGQCILELSGGLCQPSDTISTPAGSVPACVSNVMANQASCNSSERKTDCQTVAQNTAQLASLARELPNASPERKAVIEQGQTTLRQARDAASQRLAASGCSLGYCKSTSKTDDAMQLQCATASSSSQCRDPCRWSDEDSTCTYPTDHQQTCSLLTDQESCNRHKCEWDAATCMALPQDGLMCTGNKTRERCLSPDCIWDAQPDAYPTTNLDSETIACAEHARDVVKTLQDTNTSSTALVGATDDAQLGDESAPVTTPCRLEPSVAGQLDTQVGNNVGTQLAAVCPLFQQQHQCQQYGCSWTSPQTWKCTNSNNRAELEPLCNTVRQYAQCQQLRGMCEPVDLETMDGDTEHCAADCDWEAEASKYYAAGIAIGRYEVDNHVRLGVDNVAHLMGYTEAFAQRPTAACPHVCDGTLLKMWLEEGMVYENKGNRMAAGLDGSSD